MSRPCQDQFLRSAAAPDMTMWPYDTPWIMKQMREHNLEVHNTGMIDRMQAAIDDLTERCRTAERRGWDAAITQDSRKSIMHAIIAIAIILATAAPIDAKAPKKRPDANGNVTRKCDAPKRWVEIDALADDAGRPSPRICK